MQRGRRVAVLWLLATGCATFPPITMPIDGVASETPGSVGVRAYAHATTAGGQIIPGDGLTIPSGGLRGTYQLTPQWALSLDGAAGRAANSFTGQSAFVGDTRAGFRYTTPGDEGAFFGGFDAKFLQLAGAEGNDSYSSLIGGDLGLARAIQLLGHVELLLGLSYSAQFSVAGSPLQMHLFMMSGGINLRIVAGLRLSFMGEVAAGLTIVPPWFLPAVEFSGLASVGYVFGGDSHF